MHKVLKTRLWSVLDDAVASSFTLRPQKRTSTWRIYKEAGISPGVFLTIDYFDRAGGLFTVDGGISKGGFPSQADVASDQVPPIDPGGFAYVSAEAFGLHDALLEVDLDWQTPSGDLVRQALQTPDGKTILAGMGVTPEAKHHLLSYGMVEAVGVAVPDSEFDLVAERFQERLDQVMRRSILPMVAALRAIACG